MAVAVVTGSGGLIGSESVRHFAQAGYSVIGIENDMRASFFGTSASTRKATDGLLAKHPEFRAHDIDIRDAGAVTSLFAREASKIELVVHAAAQPSHDWAALDPHTDFEINALGTLNLLEATRRHAPAATFMFLSTNKVYGDRPNSLPLEELPTRLELPRGHRYWTGIDESMSIDRSMHSLFGVSKTAADLMVQEYGRYFDIPTVCFRCGCLTGADHAGTRLHGFLSYLLYCTVTAQRYEINGYGGKQVRDNLHSSDVVSALAAFHAAPRAGAVYNLGGGRRSNCSILEAVAICERVVGRDLAWELKEQPRTGDHRWWITDVSAFESDYAWDRRHDLDSITQAIYDGNREFWLAGVSR